MAKTSVVCPLAMIFCSALASAQEAIPKPADAVPKPAEAAPEHAFLKRFVGQWTCENEAFMARDQPAIKSQGTMTGTMIGDFWATVIVKGEVLGQSYHGQGTFGYDGREKQKYIGTWTDSMSDHLWHYKGTVDGNKLILQTEGPDPADPRKMIKARDTYEFRGPDLMVLTGEMEGPDGKLTTVMKATCRRVTR